MTTIKKVQVAVLAAVLVGSMLVGCAGKHTDNSRATTAGNTAGDITVSREPETEAPTKAPTEAPTQAPTEPPTEAPTEAPTQEYIGAWTLLSEEPLNPTQSGYPELDSLVNDLIARTTTSDMNNYQKVWALYEYFIDNITYSRGMDAHTGEYSSSDKATTPKEVLWATDLLNSGQGCCYNYSSAFMYIMRALGYDAHLVSGNVPKYGGGVTPHCWLYVNLRGGKYTFDPDLDMNFYTRDLRNGVENPARDRYFCVPIDNLSYFYVAETYHTN